MENTRDNFQKSFSSFEEMHSFIGSEDQSTTWERVPTTQLHVVPLKENPMAEDGGAEDKERDHAAADKLVFHPSVTHEAIEDTIGNLALAVTTNRKAAIYLPARDTAYAGMLDRAGISGNTLAKLPRNVLSDTLNECYAVQKKGVALVMMRGGKLSGVHSGEESGYSTLERNRLMYLSSNMMDARFPGWEFTEGFTDHWITTFSARFPYQKLTLMHRYERALDKAGKSHLAGKLIPGARFITSDTRASSAKLVPLLVGDGHVLQVGGALSLPHKNKKTLEDFSDVIGKTFTMMEDTITALAALLDIPISYPVSTMREVCKKMRFPDYAVKETVNLFAETLTRGETTAHDVYMALREIPAAMKAKGVSRDRMLTIEEKLAQVLFIDWKAHDIADREAA